MNSYQYSLFDDASRKLKEEQQQQTEQGVELQEESTETKDPKQFGLKDNIKEVGDAIVGGGVDIYNSIASLPKLLDKDFYKPQAFHDTPVTRSGGVAAIISLSVFFVIYYSLYSKILYDYILVSYSMFFVGFLDDLKINIKPFKRLIIMVVILFLIIYTLIKKKNE